MSLQSLTKLERQELFLVALDTFRGNISQACAAIGISRTTYYKWMDTDEEFEERYRLIKLDTIEERLDNAEARLDENVDKGISADIRYFLDNHGGRRGFGKKKVEVDFTFKDHFMPEGEYPEEIEDVDQWEKLRDAQKLLPEGEEDTPGERSENI